MARADADGPCKYGPYKTLYNRSKYPGTAEIVARMMDIMSATGSDHQMFLIDATYLKAHGTTSSPQVKKEAQTA